MISMAQGLRYSSTAFVLSMLVSSLTPVHAKDLSEEDCKAPAMQAEVITAMNRQAVLRPSLKVEAIEFVYLETGQKPFFCAFLVNPSHNDGYLFAVTPLPARSGQARFEFDFLD